MASDVFFSGRFEQELGRRLGADGAHQHAHWPKEASALRTELPRM